MATRQTVEKLIDDVLSKLNEEINMWKTNIKLRIESEFHEVLKDVVNRFSTTIENTEKELTLERESRLYELSMNFKKEKLRIVDELYNEILGKVREKVAQLRGSEIYMNYLRKLLESMREVIGQDKEVVIKCFKDDVDVVHKLTQEMGIKADIQPLDKDILGLIISTKDESVIVDLSIDARLNILSEQIRSLILKLAK